MKERTTSVYLGEAGDMKFYPSSSLFYKYCDDLNPDDLLALYQYQRTLASYAPYPVNYSGKYVGKEVFDSTKRKQPLMNNCYHSNIRAKNLPYAMWYRHYSVTNMMYQVGYYRLPFPNVGINADFQHLITEHSGPSRRAWWHMQPRFEGEISVVNFLFELKDFKDLMKYVVRPKYAYSNINKLMRHPPKSVDPTKPAAAGFLTWNLAIAPFLRDLTSIHAQLATLIREVQAQFKVQGSEEQSSHYTELLGSVSNLTPYYSNSYWYSKGTYQETQFTATMHYNYAYKMRGTVDAFVKYWGLNPNAEALWNMLPFSFIVDYFLGVGKSIHAMETDQNVTLHLNDYAESLLTRLSSGYIVSPDDRICSMVIDGVLKPKSRCHNQLLSGLEGTIYSRRVCSPDKGPALPRTKIPKGKQWATMAAIVRCLL